MPPYMKRGALLKRREVVFDVSRLSRRRDDNFDRVREPFFNIRGTLVARTLQRLVQSQASPVDIAALKAVSFTMEVFIMFFFVYCATKFDRVSSRTEIKTNDASARMPWDTGGFNAFFPGKQFFRT